ncbi:MAG: ribulose-phosphate 3-epimerase [Candidatus Magnetoovum sp. WYHC-5]|nr:ribulose-phosphate 3-epimerase [Candidatus Magnetoovum sp. WYHC-5]
MQIIKIAPSILSADFMNLALELQLTKEAGADYLHVDVMDGIFVPNITIGVFVIEQIKKITDLPLDVHLMIEDPYRYVPDFINAGADILTIHVEATGHVHSTVQKIKELGAKAGVSLNPATSLSAIDEIVADADLLLIMSVNPGFGGQAFIPRSIDKVRRAAQLVRDRGLNTIIEVDGGIKPDNAKAVVDAGAQILVMGSAFYKSKDYKQTINAVRASI